MDCHKCKYSRSGMSGSHHRSCVYDGLETGFGGILSSKNLAIMKEMNIIISEHGFNNGWAFFPLDFDPIWINTCNKFEEMK